MKNAIFTLGLLLLSNSAWALSENCPDDLKNYKEAVQAKKGHDAGTRDAGPSQKTLDKLKARVDKCCAEAKFDRKQAESAPEDLIQQSTIDKLDARVKDYCI